LLAKKRTKTTMRLLISTAASIVVASGSRLPFPMDKPLPAKQALRPADAPRARRRTTIHGLPLGCREYDSVDYDRVVATRGRRDAVREQPDFELPDKTVKSNPDPRLEAIQEHFQKRQNNMTPGMWAIKDKMGKSIHRNKIVDDNPDVDFGDDDELIEFESMVKKVFQLEDYYNFLVPRYMEDDGNHYRSIPVNTTTYEKWLRTRMGGTPSPKQVMKASVPIQEWRINCHVTYFSRWLVKAETYDSSWSKKKLTHYFYKYLRNEFSAALKYRSVLLDNDEGERGTALGRVEDILYEYLQDERDEDLNRK